MCIAEGREIPKRFEAREKEVGAALHGREGRQAGDLFANRSFGNLDFERAVLRADDRIALVAQLVKITVVSPYVLRELELSDQACTDDERRYAAVGTIVRSVFRAEANRKWRRGESCGVGLCSLQCREGSCGACANREAPHIHADPSPCS